MEGKVKSIKTTEEVRTKEEIIDAVNEVAKTFMQQEAGNKITPFNMNGFVNVLISFMFQPRPNPQTPTVKKGAASASPGNEAASPVSNPNGPPPIE